MKFAFSSNAFLRSSLLEAIRIVSSIGYQAIEIMADVPHAFPASLSENDIISIRRETGKSGIEISNINAFMHHADGDTYHPSWIEKDADLRRKRLDYTLRCIDLAAKLGAPNISTEPGGPLEDIDRDQAIDWFVQGLKSVEKQAREKKIRVLIEPEPGLLIENSVQFLDIIGRLDPDVFGINFDIGHFYCVGEDPSALLPKLKPYIDHFHLEDIAATREHHHLMLGHGAIDIPSILDSIEDTGYKGFVTVELYTYEHRAQEAAREAFDFLQRYRSGKPS